MNLPIDSRQMKDLTQNGAPAVLHAVGRMFGLGQEERNALSAGKIPWWGWLAGGLAVGMVVGARVQNKWPTKLPVLIRGGE